MDLRLTFFGISFPWLAVVLLHLSGVLVFHLPGRAAKMSSERIHPLSKLQAIAALATAGFPRRGDHLEAGGIRDA